MIAAKSLISELESAIQGGSVDQRVATMKRVTDLFLHSAQALSEQQVGVFDDVLMHLVKWVETKALGELSRRLAPVRNAPIGVVQHLARHDEIAVAGPVLSNSERLSTADLIEIAKKKGEAHLLAISGRPMLVEAVTDILLQHGTSDVYCKLSKNAGASFSKAGFESLINRAQNDVAIAENLGHREDIPRHVLHELVTKATQAVRIKLLASAPSELHTEIKDLLSSISRSAISEMGPKSTDRDGANEFILELQRKNRLKASMLGDFARAGDLEKLTAALAALGSARMDLIDRLVRTIHYGGLLVACKAADLPWDTVETILQHRLPNFTIAAADLAHAKSDYAELSKPTAVRMLGFWQAQAVP